MEYGNHQPEWECDVQLPGTVWSSPQTDTGLLLDNAGACCPTESISTTIQPKMALELRQKAPTEQETVDNLQENADYSENLICRRSDKLHQDDSDRHKSSSQISYSTGSFAQESMDVQEHTAHHRFCIGNDEHRLGEMIESHFQKLTTLPSAPLQQQYKV